MEPSDADLIERIADVLRNRIAPLLADQPWPSSELRSMDALLALVAARIRHEDGVLTADNADLDALLDRLRAAGVEIATPLDRVDASAAEINIDRRAALEDAIHRIHDGAHEPEVAAVRAYLVTATQREQVVYGALADRRMF